HTGAERFGASLLGGETLGVSLRLVDAPAGLGALRRRKNAGQKAFAVALDAARDAPHVREVRAKPDNHDAPALARPRSIAARMNFTVSASPSNTASPIR